MSHETFKVCILIDNLVENFYIKHYIDEYQPIFNRFKSQVFTRNPNVNTPTLKIYWIDSENDEILVACEEDFRLFLEQGKGRKIYFAVKQQEEHAGNNGEEAMDAEEIQQKCERRSSRKGRDEEKQRRHAKKLAEKLKHLEEKCYKNDHKERHHSEKREQRHAERMDKAKRRVEQIRSLIGSIDPANLNNYTSNDAEVNVGASTSTSTATATDPIAIQGPSPETIRLLSSAIAGCLQPCNLINKILNEVIGMIPQMTDDQSLPANPPPYSATVEEAENHQQQKETKHQNSQATNTSDANTPVVAVRQASHEIEALFKEAAKELEKMNEIVNSSKSTMETSTSSSGVTQIERTFANITDSAISNATIINASPENENIEENDEIDGQAAVGLSFMESSFKTATPPRSMRSRESSIEVHDVNSMMSDDSREWTILDQEDNQDNVIDSIPENESKGAIPKKKSVDNFSQFNNSLPSAAISIETQTPTTSNSLMSDSAKQELQASVQKSIDIVQKSIETIQKTMENAEKVSSAPQPGSSIDNKETAQSPPQYGILNEQLQQMKQIEEQSKPRKTLQIVFDSEPSSFEPIKPKYEPAVIVYDPNPKVNAAVHTMMNMGFTNEDNWLTQLLLNVDGDIPKALHFLTPQPKSTNNKK